MFHNYFYDMREKKEKIIMSKISGSEIVIECLKEQGVDTVFGYPGGTILNVYDALYKHQDEINHVLTSHEQGAARCHGNDGDDDVPCVIIYQKSLTSEADGHGT